jgi:hypothetical protein
VLALLKELNNKFRKEVDGGIHSFGRGVPREGDVCPTIKQLYIPEED